MIIPILHTSARVTVRLLLGFCSILVATLSAAPSVHQWGVGEISLTGPSAGNPFVDTQLSVRFTHGTRTVASRGFYDGEGIYRARFMPDEPGAWAWRTESNQPELNGKTGELTVDAPARGTHGPVRVRDKFHFAYADGTPYFPFGTTCYAWAHQGDELEEQTLLTLRTAGFNKLRMTVFPKDYTFNKNEPVYHPFERNAQGKPDFVRFNPAFFRHFEKRLTQLGELGVEADIILFHPYDRWGYARMDEEADLRYLGYLIARLAAFRNVWWSAANEYDLFNRPEAQWDRYLQFIELYDPYGHLRSIHNGRRLYDHSKSWITHVSIQHPDTIAMAEWRDKWGKPVVDDECEYEGNIPDAWGNLAPQELTHRVWNGVMLGGYVGHGETYLDPNDVLWWSKGGALHGEAYKRMSFLRKLLEEENAGIDPKPPGWLWRSVAEGTQGPRRWAYFGRHQASRWTTEGLAGDRPYRIDIIDTWEMNVKTLPETFHGKAEIVLPARSYMAVRVRPAD
jgi:hypothetical protein